MRQYPEKLIQLPEKMKQYPEVKGIFAKIKRGICTSIEFVMFMFGIIIAVRFLYYNPGVRNSSLVGIFSLFGYSFSFLFSTILPLVLEMSDKNILKRWIVSWWIVAEKRERMIKRIIIAKGVLILLSLLILMYIYPRSFAPKMYDITYKKHDETVANTTDIMVTVETNLTVEKIVLYDNKVEIEEGECLNYDEIGNKRIFSKVVDVNPEDNKHEISAEITYVNNEKVMQTISCVYNINVEESSGESLEPEEKVTLTPTPTLTLTPTPPAPEKTETELTAVCVPADKLESIEDVAEDKGYINSAGLLGLMEFHKMAFPTVDAFIIVITNKKMTGITLYAVSETTSYPPDTMKKFDENTWYYDANFTEISEFKINITAYAEDGEKYEDQIEVSFPFGQTD